MSAAAMIVMVTLSSGSWSSMTVILTAADVSFGWRVMLVGSPVKTSVPPACKIDGTVHSSHRYLKTMYVSSSTIHVLSLM